MPALSPDSTPEADSPFLALRSVAERYRAALNGTDHPCAALQKDEPALTHRPQRLGENLRRRRRSPQNLRTEGFATPAHSERLPDHKTEAMSLAVRTAVPSSSLLFC